MSTIMEGSYNSVTQHLDDIWKLTLPEEWFGPALEQVAKTIMAIVIVARSVTIHLYVIAYLLMMFAVLTEKGSSLMVFWIFLAAMRCIFLNLISTLTGILICSFCPCTRATCFEFAVVKGVELACSVYLWLTVGGYYIKLRDGAEGGRQPGRSGGEHSRNNAQEEVPGDFVEWLSAYGLNKYGRDRAELIKQILDMSKQELLAFHEKMMRMCPRGSGGGRSGTVEESPCSIEDVDEQSTSLEDDQEYCSPEPDESPAGTVSPEDGQSAKKQMRIVSSDKAVNKGQPKSGTSTPQTPYKSKNQAPSSSNAPKTLPKPQTSGVKRLPIPKACEPGQQSTKSSVVEVEVEGYELDTSKYKCKTGVKRTERRISDIHPKQVKSDMSQRSACDDRSVKPVRSNMSQRSACEDRSVRPVKSDISQRSACEDRSVKTVKSDISQRSACEDRSVKPVKSDMSQRSACDKYVKPVKSDMSQRSACDKYVKPVRSNLSERSACDKYLKPVRSDMSQQRTYDKCVKPAPTSRQVTSDKYLKPSSATRPGTRDKYGKPVRSDISQQGARDKYLKSPYASQKDLCDKYGRPVRSNISQQGPCDKYGKPVRSNIPQQGPCDKYDRPVRSNIPQQGPCDKYDKPVRSNIAQQGPCDKYLKPVRSNISQHSYNRQTTLDCKPRAQNYDTDICSKYNACAKYDVNGYTNVSDISKYTSNTSRVGPCASLLSKDSHYNCKPTISGATSYYAPSRTGGVGGPCSVQQSTTGEGSHHGTVKSTGKGTTGTPGTTVETVRHTNEDGSIISIQVLVIPCATETEAPAPMQETPSKPDNEAGGKPSGKNDVHLCHCIVPPHISTIPCSAVGIDKPPAPVVRPGLEHLVVQPTISNEIYTQKSNLQTPSPLYSETPEKPVAQTPHTHIIRVQAEEQEGIQEPMERKTSFATLHPRAGVLDDNLFDHEPPSILTKPTPDRQQDVTPREVGAKMTYMDKKPVIAEHTAQVYATELRDSETNLNLNLAKSKSAQSFALNKSETHLKTGEGEITEVSKPIEKIPKSVSDPGIPTSRYVDKVPAQREHPTEEPEFLTRKPTLMSLEKWEQICEDFKKRISEHKEEEEKIAKDSPKGSSFRRKPKLAMIPENKEIIRVHESPVSLKETSSLNLLFASNTDGLKITSTSPVRIQNVSSHQKRISQRRVSLTDEEWLRLYEDFLQGSYERTDDHSESTSEMYLQDLYPSTDSYEKSLTERLPEELRPRKGTRNKSFTAAHALTKFDNKISIVSSESSYSDLQLLTELLLCEKEEEDKNFEQWAPLYLDLLTNKPDTFSDDTSSHSTPKSSLQCSIPFSCNRFNRKEWISKYYQFLKNTRDMQQEVGIMHSTDSVVTNLDITPSLGSFSGISYPEDDNPLSESIDESIIIETTSSQENLDGDTCQDIMRLDSKLLSESNEIIDMESLESIPTNQDEPRSVEENIISN